MNTWRVIFVFFMFILCPRAWGDAVTEDFSNLQVQARNERIKEEELQMMRLELEKLKLQLETRKAMSDLGNISTSSSGIDPLEKLNIELKSVMILPGKVCAVVEVGGARKNVCEGDALGSLHIKQIDPEAMVYVDDKGKEFKVTLSL